MIRDTLKKAAGLFVEFEASDDNAASHEAKTPEPKTVEQIVREQPGPNLDEISVPAPAPTPNATTETTDPVIDSAGKIHFDVIYKLAKLPEVPFSAEQILDLLGSLPSDLPMDSKRAAVRVTMGAMSKSMGVTTEQVVSDASRKLASLAAYHDSFDKQVDDYCARATIEMQLLEEQIAQKRKAMSDAQAQKIAVSQACEAESNRLDDVLEFFTLDVSPSKHA